MDRPQNYSSTDFDLTVVTSLRFLSFLHYVHFILARGRNPINEVIYPIAFPSHLRYRKVIE